MITNHIIIKVDLAAGRQHVNVCDVRHASSIQTADSCLLRPLLPGDFSYANACDFRQAKRWYGISLIDAWSADTCCCLACTIRATTKTRQNTCHVSQAFAEGVTISKEDQLLIFFVLILVLVFVFLSLLSLPSISYFLSFLNLLSLPRPALFIVVLLFLFLLHLHILPLPLPLPLLSLSRSLSFGHRTTPCHTSSCCAKKFKGAVSSSSKSRTARNRVLTSLRRSGFASQP